MGGIFEILNFVDSRLLLRSPENIFPRYFESKCGGYCIFLGEFFCFAPKCSRVSVGFFSKYFYVELRFCAGSNPARGVSETRDGENL